MDEKNPDPEDSAAWEDRILCSDETCIGIIGFDGRCKECGKPYAGQLPPGFLAHLAAEGAHNSPSEEGPLLEEQCDEDEAPPAREPDDDDDAIDWDNRILCSDENCIGIIGPDGRCNTCGKPYKENP